MQESKAALGVAPPFRTLEIDGVELAYSDEGAGAVLVCLHAAGHGGADFAHLRERFRGRFRVVILDWPGQGRSGPDRMAASAARYAQLLGPFLDKLGVERAAVLGNSIGGAAAIVWAARHPERVRGLVLANPGGLAPVDALTRTFSRAMSRFFAYGARGGRAFPALFAAYYRSVLRRAPAAEHRRRVVHAGRALAPVLSEAWASFAKPESSLAALAPTLACPVLFAWAKSDQVVAFWRSRKVVESFPNAEVAMLRGGHSAFLEDPEAFDAQLDGFLEMLGSDYLPRQSKRKTSPPAGPSVACASPPSSP